MISGRSICKGEAADILVFIDVDEQESSYYGKVQIAVGALDFGGTPPDIFNPRSLQSN